jgi:hypothetical protein
MDEGDGGGGSVNRWEIGWNKIVSGASYHGIEQKL